ncbi:Raf kinase inhibitor-like YbhB/YbcL family protein [Marmoricola sp. URHA0025 HA25]
MTRGLLLLAVAAVLVGGCGDHAEHASARDPGPPATLRVSSPAFDDGKTIPAEYTCHGDGTSPPLAWSGLGEDIGSLALVVDDPDARDGGYVHWVVLGLPIGDGGLQAGSLPGGATQVDGSGGHGWKPPCPPSGTHHYRFTVYAFRSETGFFLGDDEPLNEVLATIADRAVAWGRLTGTVTASGGDSGGGY